MQRVWGDTRQGCQCCERYPVRVEVLHVQLWERVFAFRRAAEPGISPARGTDQRAEGGGLNTGCYALLAWDVPR